MPVHARRNGWSGDCFAAIWRGTCHARQRGGVGQSQGKREVSVMHAGNVQGTEQ
jgi:hypothetical protein